MRLRKTPLPFFLGKRHVHIKRPVFFFFYWHYNPLWDLAFSVILFHSTLSLHCFLHRLIPIICISSSISTIHLFLGLPLVLVPIGFHCNIIVGVLLSSIRITWPSQVKTRDQCNKKFHRRPLKIAHNLFETFETPPPKKNCEYFAQSFYNFRKTDTLQLVQYHLRSQGYPTWYVYIYTSTCTKHWDFNPQPNSTFIFPVLASLMMTIYFLNM
jgi:hypothetical protein